MSENGLQAIVQAIHLRDPLSVVLSVYKYFSTFVSARRAGNETFNAFESLFEAIVSCFTAHGSEIYIAEPLLSLMLLNGSRVDQNQSLCIFPESFTSMPDLS